MAKVLVVEDRPTDRLLLVTLLGYSGHQVFEASDGGEALLGAHQHHPDLIISDVLMPSLDGYEFVRRLRQIESLANTPVIFYTATYHEHEARALARQCGVVDILIKPSEPESILATVNAVLSRQRPPMPVEVRADVSFDRDHIRLINEKLTKKLDELSAAEQRLAAVVNFCNQFAVERDSNTLLTQLASIARDVTFAKLAVVALVSDDWSHAQRVLVSGFETPPDKLAHTLLPTNNALLHALRDGRAIRQYEIGGPLHLLGYDPLNEDRHSLLAVPIASPSRVYGWLSLHAKLGSNEFTIADEQVAHILATAAAAAYENAELIGQLQQNAATLRDNEARTRYALGAAQMGVWELDLKTDRISCSESLAYLFGLKPEDMPSNRSEFLHLIHADDRANLVNAAPRNVSEGIGRLVEFRIILPGGDTRWMASQAQMLYDDGGVPSRLLGIGMDISERKSLEDQLRQSQKLEAVGQLAGGIAHDFNNLLTVILCYSEVFMETMDESDLRRAEVQEVIDAAERAAALTRQLLAFSRKQVLRPLVLDLNALVTRMHQILSRLIGDHIELEPILTADVNAVRADPGQIEQVLLNLVVNARDAMPLGGKVLIETANVELDASPLRHGHLVRPGAYVMLAVSDSGVGMSDEVKQRIFEPFFTTKDVGKGTGLGLATVHGIVTQSDGYVWAYSEPGVGSTFKVYLPVALEHDSVTEVARIHREPVGGTETVLVIEDEESVRALTRSILEKAGYHVVEAQNPHRAEAIFCEDPSRFDLIVTDVIMPGLSGPRIFARFQQIRPNLKVLYVSGYTDELILHHGQLQPGADFLQKPFSAHALMLKVRDVLDAPPASVNLTLHSLE